MDKFGVASQTLAHKRRSGLRNFVSCFHLPPVTAVCLPAPLDLFYMVSWVFQVAWSEYVVWECIWMLEGIVSSVL
jgi:hypothetical protein